MTDWQAVIDGGCQVPVGGVGDALVAELSEALRSPDPVLRDEQAFSVLAAFAAGRPGPVPPSVSNTMRTLRVLYLLADRGVRPGWNSGEPIALPHRDAVLQALADVLALVAPFTG